MKRPRLNEQRMYHVQQQVMEYMNHPARRGRHDAELESMAAAGMNVPNSALRRAYYARKNFPVYAAMEAKEFDVAKNLIERGHGREANVSTPMHQAARHDAPEMIEYLKSKGFSLNAVDASGATPLHLALAKRSTRAATKLVDLGADVTATNARDRTPLIEAVRRRVDPRVVRRVLEKNPGLVDHRSNDRLTALHYAAQAGNAALGKMLLDAGATANARNSSDRTPLHIAAGSGQPMMVHTLLQRGAAPNPVDRTGTHPIHAAIRRESLPIVKALLDAGVSPGHQNGAGRTLLQHAGRSENIVRELIRRGADVNARDADGKTPLFHAQTPSVALALINAGADPHATYAHDKPMHLNPNPGVAEAIMSRMTLSFYDVARLMDKGAPIGVIDSALSRVSKTVTDERGNTLMHLASLSHPKYISLLHRHGFSIGARNADGDTPLHLPGDEKSVKKLLQLGAHPNARNKARETPLHKFAARTPWLCEELLKRSRVEVEINARDAIGQTPLHKVSGKNLRNNRTINLLVRAGAKFLQDDRGDTPMHVAARACNDILCGEFVRAFPDPALRRIKNRAGETAYDVMKSKRCKDDEFWFLDPRYVSSPRQRSATPTQSINSAYSASSNSNASH